jgi:hypothetical protein
LHDILQWYIVLIWVTRCIKIAIRILNKHKHYFNCNRTVEYFSWFFIFIFWIIKKCWFFAFEKRREIFMMHFFIIVTFVWEYANMHHIMLNVFVWLWFFYPTNKNKKINSRKYIFIHYFSMKSIFQFFFYFSEKFPQVYSCSSVGVCM